jgi:hypothetical protein
VQKCRKMPCSLLAGIFRTRQTLQTISDLCIPKKACWDMANKRKDLGLENRRIRCQIINVLLVYFFTYYLYSTLILYLYPTLRYPPRLLSTLSSLPIYTSPPFRSLFALPSLPSYSFLPPFPSITSPLFPQSLFYLPTLSAFLLSSLNLFPHPSILPVLPPFSSPSLFFSLSHPLF